MSAAPSDPVAPRPIGIVRSPLRGRAAARRQGDEGAPTWRDRAERRVLPVHPRGDLSRPRPRVRDLEALDGTPILDLKPVLGEER